MNKNKHCLTVILLMLVIACVGYSIIHNDVTQESNGVIWDGEHDISIRSDEKHITFCGFSQLTFAAEETNQNVNFFNPPENDCAMDMEIYLADGTKLWSIDNIQPNYGVYNIELNQALQRGKYENCTFIITPYNIETGAECNGVVIDFTLNVI